MAEVADLLRASQSPQLGSQGCIHRRTLPPSLMELDTPVEHSSGDADRHARIEGIIEQVRQDLVLGNAEDARSELRQRLGDAGIQVDEVEFATLAGRVSASS